MTLNSSNRNISKAYTDKQVMAAMQSKQPERQLALKWFLEEAKPYALGYWKKRYSDLTDMIWEEVFADTDYKLVRRVKNGLRLQKGTSLKTYYTGVVGYSILDYFEQAKKPVNQTLELPEKESGEYQVLHFEHKEIALTIQEKLIAITQNAEQVTVLLLFTKGFSYKEIVAKTTYESEGACRNACLKAKKRVIAYLKEHPEEAKILKKLLMS